MWDEGPGASTTNDAPRAGWRWRTAGARSVALAGLLVALVSGEPALSQPAPLVETYEVRVASIDVVVTDGEGNPIRGLDRTHFTVYENDVPQPITNFSEIDELAARDASASGSAAPPATARVKRFVHVFLDEYSINPMQRAKTLDALGAMLEKSLVEGDEIAITRWIRRPDAVLPFTGDLAEAREALAKLRGEGVMGLTFLARRRQAARDIESYATAEAMAGSGVALDAAIAEAGHYRDELDDNLRNLAADLAMSMAMMGGLEGRRVLIFVGDSLPRDPGLEMQEAIRRVFGRMAADQAIMRSGSFRGDASRAIELIARAANAHGVTVYSLSSGLRLTSEDGGMFKDARPLGAIPLTTYLNSADSFRQIAEETGGATTLDPGTLDRALATLAGDLGAYYSIGYQPGREGKRTRAIRVEVDVPGAVARARDSMIIRSSEEELAARALGCLLQQRCDSDFTFEIRLGEPKRSKRNRYVVPMEAIVPMQSLTLVRSDAGGLAGFSVHIAAVTEAGELSEGTLRGQRVKVPPDQVGTAGQRDLKWGVELEAKKGRTTVLVAIADEVSQLVGFEKAELVIGK